MKLQQVHLRINDAATGQPTPVRLRITDADGTYYAPYGRLTEFAIGMNQDVGGNVQIGGKNWAYIDGACEILLPPGQLHLEVAKGPEFKPIDEHIKLVAGKMSLRLSIERWSDVRKQGWYSSDTRAHFLSPDAALLEGQAEDLAVVNVLVEESFCYGKGGLDFTAIPNILSFSGQQFARQCANGGVAVNTHNCDVWQGSLGLLHCHRPVFPLQHAVRASGDWTFADWCDQCHRKKGLVVWTEAASGGAGFPYGEPLADLILGKIDAFEITAWHNSEHDALAHYYRLLSAGLFVPLVGASGKRSNASQTGVMRTYVHLPDGAEPTYSAWIDAVRQGRTYASNGPLLHFTIDGQIPATGTPIVPSDKPRRIRAEARSWIPFKSLDVVCNTEILEETEPSAGPPYHSMLEFDLPVSTAGWLAVRCHGDTHIDSFGKPQRVFAHWSAVPINADQSKDWQRPSAIEQLQESLDALYRWVDGRGMARSSRIIDEARTILAKKLS